jgi:hypothetical protein
MIVNFAERAHNHNWELDPVTRSLLDTDFYKLLMLQFIWKHYPRPKSRSPCSTEPLRSASPTCSRARNSFTRWSTPAS